ncbi:MAG: LacI family DNA-binding transcriptional regulator [Chloroflexi bacterium]|nr:LacI family DNA-binding transcriptional regulator [Chloroflexota bacterium]
MISIREVAHEAGVSVTTVSYVLNNKGNISEETRQKVLEVVERLGYVPRIGAQSLRDNRARIIGYPWNFGPSPGEVNAILEEFLHYTMFYAEQRGRHLLLVRAPSEEGLAVYDDLIKSQRVDGVILSHTMQDDFRMHHLHKLKFPFVAFGQSNSSLDKETCWVDVDGMSGIRLATQHLIEQGHRRIGLIRQPTDSVSGNARYRGYVAALADYGVPYNPELVVIAEHRVSDGYLAARSLIDLPVRPTGIVAMSDTIALGAIQALRETGHWVALTGFDDIPLGEFLTPSLTSVRQPIQEVAALLVDMLIRQIDDESFVPQQHLLLPSLVIRASSLGDFGQ